MKKLSKYILFFVCIFLCTPIYAETTDSLQLKSAKDSIYVFSDSSYMHKKHPWLALGEALGVNVAVFSFNHFIMNADFAKISLKTISRNFRTGFVWDSDSFQTNLLAHPYHGGLYFNSARSNGLSFWQSAPYSFLGSLTWELFAEREPAAINDLMATTFGGIALGEITHRLSALVLDDSQRGFKRFIREFGGFLICPVQGFNRLLSGDMWRVRNKFYKYHDYDKIPVKFSIGLGSRYLADDNHFFKGESAPYLSMRAVYGDIFDTENTQPYDYFTLSLVAGLSPNQPLVSKVNLVGKLWSTPLKTSSDIEMAFGIFQHFNFFNSDEVLDNSGSVPYEISEVASFGPGFIYRFAKSNSLVQLEQRIFLSGILLGGSYTDYYNYIDRKYNMGSGYSIKNATTLDFGKIGTFTLNVHFYQIFTWKGYEHKDLTDINPLYLNTQGDKGNALLTVVNPIFEINLNKHLKLNLESGYFVRKTHYSYHPDVLYRTFETSMGMSYTF